MSEFYALTKGPDYGSQGFDANSVDPSDAVGFFDGTGSSAANGLYRAALGVGGVATLAGATVASPFLDEEQEDAYFDAVVDPIFRERKSIDDDAEGYGMGARIIGGLVSTVGAVAAGGPTSYIAAEGVGRTAGEIRDQGKTLVQAGALGLVSGLAATADVVIPGSFAGGVMRRAALGAGINVGAGAALRGVEAGVLLTQGDDRKIDVFSAEAIAVDALLGGFFGGISKAALDDVDAAMTVVDKATIDARSLGDVSVNNDQMQTMRQRAQDGQPIIEPGDVKEVPPEVRREMDEASETYKAAIREDLPESARLDSPTTVVPARVIKSEKLPKLEEGEEDPTLAWSPRDGTDIGPSRQQIRATAAELDRLGIKIADASGVKRSVSEVLDQAERDFASVSEYDEALEAAAACVLRARG